MSSTEDRGALPTGAPPASAEAAPALESSVPGDAPPEDTLAEGQLAPSVATRDALEAPLATQETDAQSPDAQSSDAQSSETQSSETQSSDAGEQVEALPTVPVADEPPAGERPDVGGEGPSFRFFGIVAAISLVADVATKAWAELIMNQRAFEPIELLDGHVNVILAYNRGGAWGLLQDASEVIRKPFFLGVSVAAILFIVSLYGRLTPGQRALKWGLPLVLGGALGNLSDRITRSQVIDFIDYRADWVMAMNSFVRRYVKDWTLTDHWPTFNVADIAICVGVGLMAVDMFTSRRRASEAGGGSSSSDGTSGGPDESPSAEAPSVETRPH